MFIRGFVAAGLLMAMSAAAVSAEPADSQGHGHGHAQQHASSSGATVSSRVASGLAAGGSNDPNVMVIRPGAGSATAAIVCSSKPDAWAKPLNDSDWISTAADCTATRDAGQYRYDIKFNVSSGTTGVSLSGSLLSDDNVVGVALNGHALALNGSGGPTSPATFSTTDQSFFVVGANTLSITVNNASGATGLDFQARVQSDNPTTSADGNGTDKDNDDTNNAGEDNHGQCVSEAAHSTAPGPGHGEAVREAAHNCD